MGGKKRVTGRRAKDDKEDKGFSDEQRVRREEREIEKGSWSGERERERVGGRKSENRRQHSAVLGGAEM